VAKSLGDLRLTDGGSMIGSLYYMAPEQVKGSTDPDPRSDIYSAGAILYEVVTGKKPFDYEDRFSVMVAQVEELPKPPSLIDPAVPAELDGIILKALAKEPGERYSSAQDFLTALEIFQQPASGFTPAPAVRQHRQVLSDAVAGIAVLVICALAGAGTVTWNRLGEPFPPPAVLLAIPRAPENLAGVPPAPSSIAETAAVDPASNQPISAPKVIIVKQAAPAAETRKEQAPIETEAVRSKAPEARQPLPEPVEARESVPPQPEPQSPEPKKGRFWTKMNPFHKTNPFKKKKEDSALRSPGDTPSASHQN
jgi:serine/threonine-protein kinase